MNASLHMTWANLAFLHWRVPRDEMLGKVPAGLELDLWDHSAWIGITPFEMRDVHVDGLPGVPTATEFPELNVRTYVRSGGRSGVYFLSLDAGSLLAVIAARAATGLPYFSARMSARTDGDDVVYTSERIDEGTRPARFSARYRPTGNVYRSEPGSFDHWLTERYSLFVERAGALTRLDIEHDPWPLQDATADLEYNTMAEAAGVALSDQKPHVLFSRQLPVTAHWPRSA